MKKSKNNLNKLTLILLCFFLLSYSQWNIGYNTISAQSAMINVAGRHCTSLNGKWEAIIDPTGSGNRRQVWLEQKPEKKTDFYEYSFEGGPILDVPGDFNTQMTELKYYEGIVWYKKTFNYKFKKDKRLFLNFGAVNYKTSIYLNSVLIGSHEGGFTPFQFEISGNVKEGDNTIIVSVNNKRLKDGIPGDGYDWFNYGGITRDVNLIETDNSFIDDYFIQLKKHSLSEVLGWVKIIGNRLSQEVTIRIPELKVNYNTNSNSEGLAEIKFAAKFSLWSPENPKIYKVIIETETDTVADQIGFRSVETRGPEIYLNGKPLFLRGINIHEENPLRAARAYSDSDALILLTWAKELDCNLVRLAHYPHNEKMVKMAEMMGIMVWDEIPVYQNIEFGSQQVADKIDLMMREMMKRDRNRSGVIIWSLSNETNSTADRDNTLIKMSAKCRSFDSTRLITSVIDDQSYIDNIINVSDKLYHYFDVISVNEYLGWYVPWQGKPGDVKWQLVDNNKPVIISECGGEALYGNNSGPKDQAASWSEEYQENIYKDQVNLFKTIPNLSGVCPWLLVDYRSLGRMHPVYQNGWNRKGLISDRGDKKKAWYILKSYYDSLSKITY